ADDFAVGARVFNLVGSDAGKLIGSGVADTVAAGLNRVHFDGGQLRENIRHFFQFRPVQLHVLTRAEMPITLVILARNFREFAQLTRTQRAIGDRDAQHRRQTLTVEAILQTQRQELRVGQFTGEVTLRLAAVLRYAFADNAVVVIVVFVHSK